jgi:Gas vesicle synthesis protein GvpO
MNMAERRAVRRRHEDQEHRRSGRRVYDPPEDEDEYGEADEEPGTRTGSRPSRASGGLTAADAAAAGMRQIIQLTGKDPEGVTGVERSDEGWVVGVEVVEDRRVPSSADILATYEAEIDSEGDLASYHRVRRYSRAHGDASEGS